MIADEPIRTDYGDMACTEVVEIATDYLEGALPAGDARRLEHHLEMCEGCSEYLAQMHAIAGSLGGLPEDSIPAEMRDGLVAAFRAFRQR